MEDDEEMSEIEEIINEVVAGANGEEDIDKALKTAGLEELLANEMPDNMQDQYTGGDPQFAITPDEIQEFEPKIDKFFDNVSLAHPEAAAKLRQEWGTECAANMAYARRASRALRTEALEALLNDVIVDGLQLGDHPEIVRIGAAIGRRMAHNQKFTSDQNRSDPMKHGDIEREKIKEARDTLTEQINNERSPTKAKRLYAKREKLTRALVGDGPAVGHKGRVA